MAPPPLSDYRYRGARSLVLLHERRLRSFLATWSRAAESEVRLPDTSDPDYASLESLLFHVVRAARGYMIWCCESLGLPDPEILAPPALDSISSDVDSYVDHLLERWRLPLKDVPEELFHRPELPSRWGVLYCIDAMLEHAVVHPLRHELQLLELLGEGEKA